MAASLDDVVRELQKVASLLALGNNITNHTQTILQQAVSKGLGGRRKTTRRRTRRKTGKTGRKAGPQTPGTVDSSLGALGQILAVLTEHTGILKQIANQSARGERESTQSRIGHFLQNTKIGRAIGRSRIGQRIARSSIGRRILGGVTKGARGGAGAARMVGMGARAAGALGAAGGVVGGVVGGLALAAVALKGFHDAVDRATEGQVQAARKMAEVSGSMAAVMAQRDLQELQREQRQGEAQSGTMGELARSEQRRKNATEELGNLWQNGKNSLLAWGNNLIADILDPVKDDIKAIRVWLFGEDKPEPVGLGAMMPSIMQHAEQLEKHKRNMHGLARDAAAKAGGYSAPMGAALPGMIPRP